MSHASNVKLLRKQVRNVAQETFQNALTNEAVQACVKQLTEVIGTRLDEIAKNTTAQVETIDTQTQGFRRFVLQEATRQINGELANASVTMLAWQEVLVEKLGLDVKDFTTEVEERKKIIFTRLEAEAKAKEEADKKAADEAAKAAAEAKAATESNSEAEAGTAEEQ